MKSSLTSKAVIVLAMHRTGSSAVTAGIEALGIDLGKSNDYSNEENPKGFFENQDVVDINERILTTLGYTWSNPFVVGIDEKKALLDSFVGEALNIIEDNFRGKEVWALKDPRICLLLPFWQKVIAQSLGSEIYYVFALRNPMEVASSLRVRAKKFSQFFCGDVQQSLMLWFSHYFYALNSVDSDNAMLIGFDDLIQNPREQLDRMASFLEISPRTDTVERFVESFVEKGLKHHSVAARTLVSNYPRFSFVSNFYDNLCTLKELPCFDRNSINVVISQVPDIQLLKSCFQVAAPLFEDAAALKASQADNAILKNEAKQLTVDFAGKLEEISALKSIVNTNSEQINGLSTTVNSQNDQLIGLNATINDRNEQIIDLNERAIKHEKEIIKLHKITTAKDDEISDLSLNVSHLVSSLAEKQSEIDLILSSRSWRFCSLFRYLGARHRAIKNKLIERDVPEKKLLHNVDALGKSVMEHSKPLDHSIEPGFDPEFYRKTYPDIEGQDPYSHYIKYGKDEGRLPADPDFVSLYNPNELEPSKETVLVVSHEASRTGAPILALNIAQQLKKKYNVIALLLQGGDLLADFHQSCDLVVEPFSHSHNPSVVSLVLGNWMSQTGLKFAIVNSIVSRSVLPVLSQHFVPSVSLIHEFSRTYPNNTIQDIVLRGGQVVFSARMVQEDYATLCEQIARTEPVILPQGRCVIPGTDNNEVQDDNERTRIRELIRPKALSNDTVVILGAGSVAIRKGVDLFLSCAARVMALSPKTSFRFVWLGAGFDTDLGETYAPYLHDQISRAGLEDCVCFPGETSEIELAYELSDILFLSSRLDPLPNVAIDAMFEKLPVVCFENTTGIADVLNEHGLGKACVIPYLNIEKAAQRLIELIDDPDERTRLGHSVNALAAKIFDMETYVDSLEKVALKCLAIQNTQKIECSLIEADGAFNLNYYSPPDRGTFDYHEMVHEFVRTWEKGIDCKKPFPGFHPGIYEEHHQPPQTGRNPLAAFIQAGKPDGPWLSETITPSSSQQVQLDTSLRVALHIHVFFPDMFLDIFQRLECQNVDLDLLISVPSVEIASKIKELLCHYEKGAVDIRIVPNRGRDIGPLLTEFNEIILEKYDVIGHVHTKKSSHVEDKQMVQVWRTFLLENLIGKKHKMASIILASFRNDAKLGLVFPDDPSHIGWTKNKKDAEKIASQLGISELPDRYFDFPVGTMFWARTEALKPLLERDFDWDYYPEEPLPIDGTVLHAIERLLPFVTRKMGYQSMTTHVPGITR